MVYSIAINLLWVLVTLTWLLAIMSGQPAPTTLSFWELRCLCFGLGPFLSKPRLRSPSSGLPGDAILSPPTSLLVGAMSPPLGAILSPSSDAFKFPRHSLSQGFHIKIELASESVGMEQLKSTTNVTGEVRGTLITSGTLKQCTFDTVSRSGAPAGSFYVSAQVHKMDKGTLTLGQNDYSNNTGKGITAICLMRKHCRQLYIALFGTVRNKQCRRISCANRAIIPIASELTFFSSHLHFTLYVAGCYHRSYYCRILFLSGSTGGCTVCRQYWCSLLRCMTHEWITTSVSKWNYKRIDTKWIQ